MNRRTFLMCLSSLPLFPYRPGRAKPSFSTGYDPELSALLESELVKHDRLHNFEREPEQQANLRMAFDIIQPATFNDLAFIVWCGYRFENTEETAKTYRARKIRQLPIEEYYPFLPLSEYGCPDTQGIFVFREQFNIILQHTYGMSSAKASASAMKLYRLYLELKTNHWREAYVVDHIFPDRAAEHIEADHLNEIGRFVGDSYGKSLPYVWCAAIAERALVQLQRSNNQCVT